MHDPILVGNRLKVNLEGPLLSSLPKYAHSLQFCKSKFLKYNGNMALRFDKDNVRFYVTEKADYYWAVPLLAIILACWFFGFGSFVAWLWNVTIYRMIAPAPPLDIYTAWGAMIVVWLIINAPLAPLRLLGRMKKSASAAPHEKQS